MALSSADTLIQDVRRNPPQKAHTPANNQADGHGDGHATVTPPAEPPKPAYTWKENEFRAKIDAGISKDVEISEETDKAYKNFLEDYVKMHARMLKNNPELRKTNTLPSSTIELTDALIDENGDIDEEKLSKFLSHPKGFIITTEQMELYQMMGGLAIGIETNIQPTEKPILAPNGEIVRTGEGQSGLNRLRHAIGDRVQQFTEWRQGLGIPRTALLYGGLFAPWVPYALVRFGANRPVEGALVGVASAGLEAAGVVIARAWNQEGTVINYTKNSQLITAIKGNPQMSEYFQLLTGMDLNSLTVTAAGDVELAPGAQLFATDRDPRTLMDELKRLTSTRQRFYREIHVPEDHMNATFGQAILEGSHFMEQSDAIWGQEIIDEYRKEPTIIGPVIPGNPFRRDPIESFFKLYHAEMNVSMKHLSQYVGEQLKPGYTDQGRTIIQEQAKKDRLAEAKGKLTGLQEKKAAEEARKSDTLTIETQQKTLSEIQSAGRKDITSVAHTADFLADVRNEIAELDKLLRGDSSTTPPTESLRKQIADKVNERNNRKAQLIDDAKTKRGLLTPPTPGGKNYQDLKAAYDRAVLQATADAEEQAKIEFDDLIKELQDQKTEAEQKRTRLIDAREKYQSAQNTLEEAERELTKDLPKELTETQQAYETIIIAATGAANAITAADLESKSIDELYAMAVKRGSPYTLPHRTPEQKDALRKMLLRAKTEQRAMIVDQYDAKAPDVTTYTIVTGAGAPIRPNDLLIMPDAQLVHILQTNAAYGGLGMSPTDALEGAKREAQRRLRVRHQIAIDVQIKDYDAQIAAQTKLIENSDARGAERDMFQVTDALLDRQGAIFSGTADFLADIGRFTNTTAVTAADRTYTPAERAAKRPQGYYEILNFLFDYREGKDLHGSQDGAPGSTPNRDEYFKKISRVLTPKKLSELLNTSLFPGATADLATTLTNLEGRINAGALSYSDMHRAFRDILNTMQAEAAARAT